MKWMEKISLLTTITSERVELCGLEKTYRDRGRTVLEK
jgi:hypothetical protein